MQHTDVTLNFVNFTAMGQSSSNIPLEYYDIMSKGQQVGVLNFKLAHTPHLCNYAGQISFTIFENFRGHRYASKALAALMPHCLLFFSEIYITCRTDNIASQKTIESVNPLFLSVENVPPDNPLFKEGYKKVRRYCVKR